MSAFAPVSVEIGDVVWRQGTGGLWN